MTVSSSVTELISDLRERGVKLWIDGGLLRFSASKSALTPALMMQMRKNKPAIIEVLKNEQQSQEQPVGVTPVSIGQEALWLLYKQHSASPAYNTAATMRFVSAIDVQALRVAFQKLIARHEPLRTTFRAVKSGVEAVIHSSDQLDFEQVSVPGATDETLDDQVRQQYLTPLNIETGPLVRVRLFSRGVEDHVLLIVVHHIVFDAFSLWLMQDELQQLYESEVTGRDCLLPSLPKQFSDFVKWQRALPDSAEGNEHWEYWQQQLAGDPVPSEPIWDGGRRRSRMPDGATFHFEINAELSRKLRDLGRRSGATPMATGLAVFQALLFRMNHETDSLVGITTSGRPGTDYTKAIGYYVNTLPIRARLDAAMSFAELLEQTRGTLNDARTHEDFPFAELVHRLKPVRDPSAPPLCRAVFGLQKVMSGTGVGDLLAGEDAVIPWGPVQVAPYKMDQQEGQFDLVLELYETSSGYRGVLKYDRHLLADDSAHRFTRRYSRLLEEVVEDPNQPIGSLALIGDEEFEALAQWSAAEQIIHPETLTLGESFAEVVAQHGQRDALVVGDETWTYQQLDQATSALALWLQSMGVTAGSRVIVACGRVAAAPLMMLACFKSGVAYVPLSPQTPRERMETLIDDTEAAIVIVSSELASELRQSSATIVDFQELPTSTPSPSTEAVSCVVDPSQTAYVICTSGSTGTPKAIAVSHDAICRHVESIGKVYGTDRNDRVYQFSDLTFDPSIEQMLVPWAVGGCVVFRQEGLPSVKSFWDQMRDEKISIANLPPKYFQECSRELPVADAWPTAMKLMIVGGDVFPEVNVADWLEHGVRILNAYGPTETVITATTYQAQRDLPSRIPIGKPKPGVSAIVLDANDDLCPIGVTGELCFAGPILAEGYLNAPEATGSSFRSVDQLNLDARLGLADQPVYRTGDLVRWNSNGELEFFGRMDRQVKIRGFRIELGEIESVLQQLPGVTASVVKALDTEGEAFLAAFVTTDSAAEVTSDSLSAALKRKLPVYMVPPRIVTLDAMPLLASGKIDVSALKTEPPSKVRRQRAYVEPRNQIEQIMANVWASVLEVPRIGIMDDFYELGGGSLQSLRIVSELTDAGLELDQNAGEKLGPEMLFQYTTISELSSHLRISE